MAISRNLKIELKFFVGCSTDALITFKIKSTDDVLFIFLLNSVTQLSHFALFKSPFEKFTSGNIIFNLSCGSLDKQSKQSNFEPSIQPNRPSFVNDISNSFFLFRCYCVHLVDLVYHITTDYKNFYIPKAFAHLFLLQPKKLLCFFAFEAFFSKFGCFLGEFYLSMF